LTTMFIGILLLGCVVKYHILSQVLWTDAKSPQIGSPNRLLVRVDGRCLFMERAGWATRIVLSATQDEALFHPVGIRDLVAVPVSDWDESANSFESGRPCMTAQHPLDCPPHNEAKISAAIEFRFCSLNPIPVSMGATGAVFCLACKTRPTGVFNLRPSCS
jgi:hypothetical protein